MTDDEMRATLYAAAEVALQHELALLNIRPELVTATAKRLYVIGFSRGADWRQARIDETQGRAT
jgi:hypothetical protein